MLEVGQMMGLGTRTIIGMNRNTRRMRRRRRRRGEGRGRRLLRAGEQMVCYDRVHVCVYMYCRCVCVTT